HVRFRRVTPNEQLQKLGLRSPLGAAGSIVGFVAIVAAVACTWWVQQSSVAAKSAIFYFAILSIAYFLARKKSPPESEKTSGATE
ncbi:MAG: hypothetical protein ACM3SW_10245, partial [Actinomycetota bacterium]